MSAVRDRHEDPHWYKDAVIYELHVRAFFDSNADGIGDFKGLVQKLDYLQDLGITAIWLLPFYPSPLKDDGYDIADYRNVNPVYGRLGDFKKFLQEAHRRDIRVITELVVNHTSRDHPWFERARQSPAGSRYRDFYVWSDTPERYEDARIIFKDFETSNWTWDPVAKAYYWHRFYSHQPDLNFENPEVQQALFRVLDFWMDMGVDGMRLDAVPYLYERDGTNCENLPETHAFLKKLRRHVDENYRERLFLAEANQWPEDAAAYFGDGDECHMNFHFPLMPRMFMALQMEDHFPLIDILRQTPEIPDNCQWATFLRNHDELTLEMVTDEDRDYMWRVYAEDSRARINLGIRRRLAPLLKMRRKIELMNALLFSLPGTPVIYYGDEIGMGDNIYLGDRDAVRTPMQWSGDRNAGFSRANPQRLYLPVTVDPEYHYEAVNVEAQQSNPSSLLWWMKRLIAHAKSLKAFGRGSIVVLEPDNHKVFAFIRSCEEQDILVVTNLSRFPQHCQLDLREYRGRIPKEVFGQVSFPPVGPEPYLLTLAPHSFFWFELERDEIETVAASDAPRPSLGTVRTLEEVVTAPKKELLESYLLGFVQGQRWFRSKARRPKSVSVSDYGVLAPEILMLWLEVEFFEGNSEVYLLPLMISTSQASDRVSSQYPRAIVAEAELRTSDSEDPHHAIIHDASVSEEFAEVFLKIVTGRRKVRTERGQLSSWNRKEVRGVTAQAENLSPKLGKAEQTNTSIRYGDRFMLKLFRVCQAGLNPDIEIGRFLTERGGFANTPKMLGTLEYQRGNEACSIAALQEFIPNKGDAWELTVGYVQRYYETALSRGKEHLGELQVPEEPFLKGTTASPPEFLGEALGGYLSLAKLLAERSAQMHRALTTREAGPDFVPEAFSELYQRSLYQSARSLLLRTMTTLKGSLSSLPDDAREMAEKVLDLRSNIDHRLREITSEKVDAFRIRTHGDFHLGQVLFTGSDFIIIDFEGEPARSLSERRFKRSPLRDVAGMLRSFHYASVFGCRTADFPAPQPILDQWGLLWTAWVCEAYLGAYFEASKGSLAMPEAPEHREKLLQFYLLEKCVYELAYELNNRPNWVRVPMAGLIDLIEPGEANAPA